MKKITTFLGCVGVVCLFSGCSSEDDLGKIITPSAPVAEVVPSSDSKAPASSGNSTANSSAVLNSSSNTAPQSGSSVMSSGAAVPDTVHKQVVIKSSASSYPDPYFSSGIFCWTAECETKWAGVTSSSAAPKSSSSMTIDIGMSVEAPVYPKIEGNVMTDLRDNQTYKLVTVGSTRWMDSNLKYKPKSGVYCEHDGDDVCATYGGFYTWRMNGGRSVDDSSSTTPNHLNTASPRNKATFGLSRAGTTLRLESRIIPVTPNTPSSLAKVRAPTTSAA